MRNAQRIGILTLFALVAATVLGLVHTGGSAQDPQARSTTGAGTPASPSPVDLSPLSTARRMAPLAATPDEQELAQHALRVADAEVDLAFAEALRQAVAHPPATSAETRAIQERLENARRLLQEDQARAARLTGDVTRGAGNRKAALAIELELAKAQVELDQDEVDDAEQDLIRAGGDPQARIQRMVQEHEAAAHGAAAPAAASPAAASSAGPALGGFIGRGLFRQGLQWWGLHKDRLLLREARLEAEAASAALSQEHRRLEGRIDAQVAAAPELARRAGEARPGASSATARGVRSETSGATAGGGGGSRDSATLVTTTRGLAADKKDLAALDRKMGNQKDLADVYARWSDLVAARQRGALHAGLIGVLLILLVAVVGLFFDSWLERIVGKVALERRRAEQLRTVTRVVLRAAGVVLLLVVIFGPPGQVATFLGLAGAGLTVALKDFIVGFIGWFVLMGRNGIRLGDWVEINDVSGEVVELGPFHTVLLETGNWAASGHPTGRRVTFVNSFAIEGHYFNFSTSGQWLWDEVHAHLPAGQDPYPIVEALSAIVAKETEANARHAEQEWARAAPSKELRGFSAAPAVTIRPGSAGFEIVARYITRASERHLLRSRLYQAIVELMGRKGPRPTPSPLGPPQRATDIG